LETRGGRRPSSAAGLAEAAAVDLRVATSLAQASLHAELGDALAAALLEPIAQARGSMRRRTLTRAGRDDPIRAATVALSVAQAHGSRRGNGACAGRMHRRD